MLTPYSLGAAAFFQNIRSALQKVLKEALSDTGATFVRFGFGFPLALAYLAFLVAWLDEQKAVDTGRGIGAIGFCMTGSWTIRAAAAVPDRVKAPSSFHGGGLVTDAEDSPHRLASQIQGGALIAIAENDHEREPEAQGELIAAFEAAGVPAEIEVYDDAMHGWVPTDSRAHSPEQSERAWARMLALFKAQLG